MEESENSIIFQNINDKSQIGGHEDFNCFNKLSDCHFEEIKSGIHSLTSSDTVGDNLCITVHEKENIDNNIPVYYDEDSIERRKSPSQIYAAQVENNYDVQDDSDDCVIIENPEQTSIKLPLPPQVPLTIQNDQNNFDSFGNILFDANTCFNFSGNNSFVPINSLDGSTQYTVLNYNAENTPCWKTIVEPFSKDDSWTKNQEYSNNVRLINMDMISPMNNITSNDLGVFSSPGISYGGPEAGASFCPIQPALKNMNHLKNNSISGKIVDPTNNITVRNKLNEESIMLKRKRKREEKMKRMKETTGIGDRYGVLNGLKWRDGPASYWYDLYNIPVNANIIDHRIIPTIMSSNVDESFRLPNIDLEMLNDNDSKFSTWELVQWEEDIIIDSQVAKDEIIECIKKYASHAGWIPSEKHVNMMSFQNVHSGEYFGIWPASSTGTNILRPDISQWHSIFVLENVNISSADWISNIITDPRNSNAQQPYLLELDLNNEQIHFDFTNPKQTIEILNSEPDRLAKSSACVPLSSFSVENSIEKEAAGNEILNTNDPPIKDSKFVKKLNRFQRISESSELNDHEMNESKSKYNSEFTKYLSESYYQFIDPKFEKTDIYLDFNECQLRMNSFDDQIALKIHGIQHSLPALQLNPLFFPIKLSNQFLRTFHKPRLSDVKKPIVHLFQSPQSINNLSELMKNELESRQQISKLTGNGDVFFMRSVPDLSASIDQIVLAEYCEEYPPLMMQTGMVSRIVNYFVGSTKEPVIMPQLHFGEIKVTERIPFLGQMPEYHILQALENNMFRAPIYSHKMRNTDFLVIVKSNILCIRKIDDIFLVGQQLPLLEVPAPNSKKANTFLKDFLQVQIIRKFLQSQSIPKVIRNDEIKSIFSELSDAALKKRLKMFAEHKKFEGVNNVWGWVLKSEIDLPTEDELIECISPEECCAYYSMMWGLQRLEDAGYNSKTFMQADPDQQDDDDEKENHLKIEDEVKAAPWHTTKTFLDAQKGKCYMELIGATDPTGCGEGFSYWRLNAKTSLFKEVLKNKFNKQTSSSTGKRMLTGTDADLRKLTIKKAFSLLKECGIAEHEIKKLKRWDIIDLVRQMSTQKAKYGEEEENMMKFARSTRLSAEDQEERYRYESQRIFNLQNQVLANTDELTTDDGSSDDDDINFEEVRKSVYTPFDSRIKSRKEMEIERIRKPLEKWHAITEANRKANGIASTGGEELGVRKDFNKSYRCLASAESARAILKFKSPVPKETPKVLCIRRVLDNGDGTKTSHCQTIPWSYIVKIYFKMNQEHNVEYLSNFCGLGETKEEEKKTTKKQDHKKFALNKEQKQKIKKNLKMIVGSNFKNPIKRKYLTKIVNLQLQNRIHSSEHISNINCGACGRKGHMRSNKNCPYYGKTVKKGFNKHSNRFSSKPNKIKSSTTYQRQKSLKSPNKSKVKKVQSPNNVQPFFVDLTQPTEDVSNETFEISFTVEPQINEKISKDIVQPQNESINSIDLTGPSIEDDDDVIPLKLVIPKQNVQHSSQCSVPVTEIHSLKENSRNISKNSNSNNKSKIVKDNLGNQSKKPILSSSKKNAPGRFVKSNYLSNSLLACAKQSEYLLKQKMKSNRKRIDPKIGLNHQFEEIYKGLMQVPGYRCFLHPIRKRDAPEYYEIVKNPMNLSTVRMRIKDSFYETREAFLQDIKLIYDNCILFNGDDHEFSSIGKQLMSYLMEQFCVKEQKLMRLERMVNPLMDDDDMVGMRFILEKAVQSMEEVENREPFRQQRVNQNLKKDPDNIQKPMDLVTLRANIKADKYRSRDDFLEDANLLLTNSILNYGEDDKMTLVFKSMLDAVHLKFAENEVTLNSLETNLKVQYEDVSDSQIAASTCISTDRLSQIGDDSIAIQLDHEDSCLENDSFSQPPNKIRLLSSNSEEKFGFFSVTTTETTNVISTPTTPTDIIQATYFQTNKERVMADLHLTDDSEEEEENIVNDSSHHYQCNGSQISHLHLDKSVFNNNGHLLNSPSHSPTNLPHEFPSENCNHSNHNDDDKMSENCENEPPLPPSCLRDHHCEVTFEIADRD